ncbi:uncharacterized protein I206_106228 [Kwoniella pini CBS 10737]|uniref:Uncharacterized protein n=1 Tax=Kwoniella pini CBS 10737 TaxID=1296096 RepID=A0A1B9I1M9_9TREE|nr:uncharacterized protein I206_05054 [Kwoniella pini CBS 10737]OCF49361.1 hypothetical protein I206_05054 [Kwoniella pini CBS 10737]
MVTEDDKEKPYYLQQDSEEEQGIVLPAEEDDPTIPPDESKKDKQERVEKEKQAGVRRVKVGKVEVDPNIDYANFSSDGPGLDSKAILDEMGMINIWVDLKKPLPDLPKDYARPVKEFAVDRRKGVKCPPLNIVIFIVGSRGDVQPYMSLALHLITTHSHRVRIATHPDFKDFVIEGNKYLKGKKGVNNEDVEGNLEYFDVGGNPKELMAYMVKNPGLMPGMASLTNGDIASKRTMTGEMLEGFHKSTYTPDLATGRPFAADAIISNPPAFAHVHIAEALGLPLHMSFTMPWSATTAFNHPLVNVEQSNAEKGLTNYLSFALAEMLTWQGLGDVINSFRSKTLYLEPLSMGSGPSIVDRLKIPWTYCWSEGLIEKPKDWKEHIDISGFYFMESDSTFQPEADLKEFLDSGEPPIYVGFGSVVVEDATAMTKTIFEAVKSAKVRALVSAGWGGLGGAEIPENVFILEGNIPHDWLFSEGRVSAVCHHGGAGTTAIGLRNGLPTIVVPFFGDQAFWGNMIHKAGAGPAPIPQKTLNVDNLAKAIEFATSPHAKSAAGEMAQKIKSENGEIKGVESFHRHLPLLNMRCDVDPSQLALWYSEKLHLRLSGPVAALMVEKGKLDWNDLEIHRAKEYDSKRRVTDPISGGATAILGTVTGYYSGIAQIFYNPPKGIINTTTAIPRGLMNIVDNVYEGMGNIPRMIGSQEVREQAKVDDFESGVKEGAKGVFYGYWDGITGLVREPVEGAKKEGFVGAIKGMGRSYVNATVRPAIGIMGAISLPLRGATKAFKNKFSAPQEIVLQQPRKLLSIEALSSCSDEKKTHLSKRFEGLTTSQSIKQRRDELKKRAKRLLEGDETALDEEGDSQTDGGNGMSEKVNIQAEPSPTGQIDASKVQVNVADNTQDKEEKKLSQDEEEAERRGYERALKELKMREGK